MEEWRIINDFPNYEVSNLGRVRNKKTGYLLKPLLNNDDYLYVDLYKIPQKPVHNRIHRLVADAFLGPSPDLVVNHKDGDKHNNVLSNIEWVTAKENSTLASKAGLYKTHPIKIVETDEKFRSVKDCARAIGVHPSDVNHVISGAKDSIKGLTFEYLSDDEYEKSVKKERFLYDHQKDALTRMKDGCILNGGVGSGKSRTGLYYYFSQYGGSMDPFVPMKRPKDLYILTTARKRDTHDWETEMAPFLMSTDPKNNTYGNKIVVDSWNNIKKYINVKDAFFIFDEDRVTGSGVWVKSFLKIVKSNRWILLSATAGDTWMEYVPVFIANGFFKNKTEFCNNHVVYSRFTKYPKVDRYINTGILMKYRNQLLIDMDFKRPTTAHHEDVYVQYDILKYKNVMKNRWNPFTDAPIVNASELCYTLRKIVNGDESRQVKLLEILENHPKAIIFYNHDHELDILRNLAYREGTKVAEWNGHNHQPIPEGDKWVYLVQYAACEGWNCIKTDTIIFYSQNYSYKVMVQASGRIDRLNTPYKDLYYYHLKSRSGIDLAISKALAAKKDFNVKRWTNW